MSDFLLAFLDDVDKQVDIARSATNLTNQRKQKYVKESKILGTLNEAEYDDDSQLLNVLTLIGLQMSGYIERLKTADIRSEEHDSEGGADNGNLEVEVVSPDHPNTSGFMY